VVSSPYYPSNEHFSRQAQGFRLGILVLGCSRVKTGVEMYGFAHQPKSQQQALQNETDKIEIINLEF